MVFPQMCSPDSCNLIIYGVSASEYEFLESKGPIRILGEFQCVARCLPSASSCHPWVNERLSHLARLSPAQLDSVTMGKPVEAVLLGLTPEPPQDEPGCPAYMSIVSSRLHR